MSTVVVVQSMAMRQNNHLFTVSFIIQTSIRDKIFGPNVLTREDFHTLRLTVADKIEKLRFASITTTIPMAKTARTEYDSGRMFNGEGIKLVHLFTVSSTIWEGI